MKEFLTTIRISRFSSDFSEVDTLDYEETDVARTSLQNRSSSSTSGLQTMQPIPTIRI
jgi:hypothetical protein